MLPKYCTVCGIELKKVEVYKFDAFTAEKKLNYLTLFCPKIAKGVFYPYHDFLYFEQDKYGLWVEKRDMD